MFLIESNSVDPAVNLATEEFLLKQNDQEFAFIYIDKPSVIIGKHQNALAEINVKFVRTNGISVNRRISGGGAVYHDQGNINFCFIRNGQPGKLVDFGKHTAPLISFLDKLGKEARFEGHNSLTINGMKISGNAEHTWKNRVLHHGTLLFSTDLKILRESLSTGYGRYQDKAVKSVSASVANIYNLIDNKLNTDEFRKLLTLYISNYFSCEKYFLSLDEMQTINLSAEEKYSGWEWNFGYSPSYCFQNVLKSENENINVQIEVENGLIIKLNLPGAVKYGEYFENVEKLMTGVKHEYKAVLNVLKNAADGFSPSVISIENLADSMF
ncbi:MAG: lipoate--protein ligase [Bacteroidia bacterium]|nr:lipoate--protein ligase [Bacteroidia bacterium]